MKRILALAILAACSMVARAEEIPTGLILVDSLGQGHASEATVKIVTRAVRVVAVTGGTYDYLTLECNSAKECRHLAEDTIRFFPRTAQQLVVFAGSEPDSDPVIAPRPKDYDGNIDAAKEAKKAEDKCVGKWHKIAPPTKPDTCSYY